MSRDYGELEQEFIKELKGRTGRDLAEWMSAIDAATLEDRNSIIDWLRPQGFTFAHASWLERIHHNGGAPVYTVDRKLRGPEGVPGGKPAEPAVAARLAPTDAPLLPNVPQATSPNDTDLGKPVGRQQHVPCAAVQSLMDQGKAYRPLAHMLVLEIKKALPDVAVAAQNGFIQFSGPALFGSLLVSSKGLRMALVLPAKDEQGDFLPGRPSGFAKDFTHAATLTDARQINAELLRLVETARAHVNG